MGEIVHRLKLNGQDATLTWQGRIEVVPARVYTLAFTSSREILLVSGGAQDPYRWLPGGGIKPKESPQEALRRELLEEADASILAMEELGSQHVAIVNGRSEYQRYYWCRIMLAPQDQPRIESTLRHLVSPKDFLDTLEWGRKDPKAAILLELALHVEQNFSVEAS